MPTTVESRMLGANYEKARLDDKGVHDVALRDKEGKGSLLESFNVIRSHKKYSLEAIKSAAQLLQHSTRELAQLSEKARVSAAQFAYLESQVAPEDKASLSAINDMQADSGVSSFAQAKLERYCAKAEKIIKKRTFEKRVQDSRIQKLERDPYYNFAISVMTFVMHVSAYNSYITAMSRANEASPFGNFAQKHRDSLWSRPFVLTHQVEKDLMCKPLISYFTEDTRSRFCF